MIGAEMTEQEQEQQGLGIEATDYEVAVNVPSGEVRVLFRNEVGILSSHVMDAPEAYAFAQKILQGYDRVEGL